MSAITEEHIAFARAVVELARQHKMNRLRLEFAPAFLHPTLRGFGNTETITMSWSEGRHGDSNKINLECRAVVGVEEKP